MNDMTKNISTIKFYKNVSQMNSFNNDGVIGQQVNPDNAFSSNVLGESAPDQVKVINNSQSYNFDMGVSSRDTKTLIASQKKSNIENFAMEYQFELYDCQLENLLEFGFELVTNLKLAQEKQVLQRRATEQFLYDELLQCSKEETNATIIKFKAIEDKWNRLTIINEPMELFEELENQKRSIEEVLISKDNIIDQCQAQIKNINEKFITSQEKYAQDISCLIERIDTQVELAKSVYDNHLENIQILVNDKHNLFTQAFKEKWENILNSMQMKGCNHGKLIDEKNNFYNNELKAIATKQEQTTHLTKTRLAKDNDMLYLELRNTQVNALMNSEKLDYNYMVLQKRNAENGMISTQQKRRINKLNDNIAMLRERIKSSKNHTTYTLFKLKKSIDKLHISISEIERKSKKIEIQNRYTFKRVWHLNSNEMHTLVSKLFEIDRLLHEQQLGINWLPPPVQIKNISPITKMIQNPEKKKTKQHFRNYNKSMILQKTSNFGNLNNLRTTLRDLSEYGGIFLDQKLHKILIQYSKNDQMILRLDYILNAIDVKNMEVLEKLTELLLPYTWCRGCCKQIPKHLQQTLYSSHENTNMQKIIELHGNNYEHCEHHTLEIEASLLMNALNDFIKTRIKNETAEITTTNETMYTYLTNTDILKFWQNCKSIMHPQKLRLWQRLLHAMKHFLEILKEREKLEKECSLLRRQNAELTYLLHNI